jgi:hypothetical protein
MSKACVGNLDGHMINTCLGEGLPRLKEGARHPENNASLPQHELIGRYVSCGVTRIGVAAGWLGELVERMTWNEEEG